MPDAQFTAIETALAECPRAEFRNGLRNELLRRIRMTAAATKVREGFTTVTPYLTVVEIDRLVEFAKAAFGAVETAKSTGSSGHPHYELRIGDSMLMCGGGDVVRGREKPIALHLYVPDADAVYQKALAAGGESRGAPQDRPYGERQGSVADPAGNLWYIATRFPETQVVEGMRTLTPYLHQPRVLDFIEFLKQAFSAEELGVYKAPEGRIMHAEVRIGNAILEMGEAPAMPASFYLYVPDADALFRQATAAGAKALAAPADQPYGDRMGVVEDAWGNTWCIATHLRTM